MFFIVGDLARAAAFRFVHSAFHRARNLIGIEHNMGFAVSRGPSDGLDHRGLGPQEPFFIGVENTDKSALRNVEAFAQQVNPDQHVKHAEPQIADQFDPFQRVDVAVHIADLDALVGHIFGQVFGHFFRQRRDQRAVALLRRLADLIDHIIDLIMMLARHRTDFDRRIDQAGGTDDLFDKHATRAFHFPIGGRGGHMDRLRPHRVPFLKLERAVIDARRQAEAMLGQRAFSVKVAPAHAADLWDRDVAFIHEE